MIRITDLRLSIDAGPGELRAAAAAALGLKHNDILSVEILRQAVDARHQHSILFTHTVAVEVRDEAAVLRAAPSGKAERYDAPVYELPAPGGQKLATRPVVVGAGPSGMLAAWVLAKGGYRPIVLERGQDMETRWADADAFMNGGALNPESNIQFGEGGAGAFSDGKLVTRVKDHRCPEVLRLLVACGAPEDILYSGRAHVGTDRLRQAIPAVRRQIEALGGEYRFGSAVKELVLKDGKLAGLLMASGEVVDCEACVLAIGHSARDTVENLYAQGVALEAKPFAVGFRAEHPQALIDRAAWGAKAGHAMLGAADYHLNTTINGRAVYSFCMCPGGYVVNASSEEGRLAVNGMSLRAREGKNANAAVVAAVSALDYGDGPLAGIAFQQMLEEKAYQLGGGWHAPAQRLGDFLTGQKTKAFGTVKPTVRPEAAPANLNGLLPKAVEDALKAAFRQFDKRMPGYGMADALLTAVESRTSAPTRMPRGQDMQAEGIMGLYPAGEGAGWAGGIVSAAVDGMRAAEALISTWRVE